jgi:hypothetical protein
MVLNFAEAANHVVGPDDISKYGISAKQAITYLRNRKTYDNANGFSVDPYLDEVAADKTLFNNFIKNERRIETCFEGMRFYDLRRWSTDTDILNNPVHGVNIVKNGGSASYTQIEVEPRVFNSAYMPIPYNEMLKNSRMIQNEGWNSWN